MAFPLTSQQRNIVHDRGGEVLVSAAAGSGKTRVLVERLLELVMSQGVDIDRFLVITYTKAAAAELRARIAQELSARLAEQPGNRHLRRQATLVYKAQISTIHAFCAALLRESGYLLDLDLEFRLCDSGEETILMAQTLEQVLDRRYEGLDPEGDFARLVDTLGAGRDDSRLAQIVLDISARAQSHPDPKRWLRGQQRLWQLEGVGDIAQTAWGQVLLEDTRRQAQYCRARLGPLLPLAEEDELTQRNLLPSLTQTVQGLDALLAADTWDRAAACFPIPFVRIGTAKKRQQLLSPQQEEDAQQRANYLKGVREQCKQILKKTAEGMEGSSAELLEELALSRPAVQALMELVLDFQAAYAAEKRRRNLLDFADLEHFALRLLLDEEHHPTPLAQRWGERFNEVMVDEFQDTNQVQNAIFSAISRQGQALFLVGDVKQSIYRFRLADPGIFQEKYRSFPDGQDAGQGQPRRWRLSQNFRSRPEVLEGCNDLFRSIMSTELGELDYTDDHALVPGASFPAGEGYALELDVLDLSVLGEQEGEKQDKNLLEARYAARRIQALVTQPFLVSQGDGLRPVRPADVMILLRSPGSVLHHYIRALGEVGLPWVAEGSEDFFQSTEVNVALSLLQVVDNPRQDVPLIAVLRSPVYDFSGDRLALLRAETEGDFYTAVTKAAARGDEACRAFLKELETLRFGAGDKTCRQMIWHIYETTNLLGLFGAMEGGGERQNNLLALYALAGELEQSGCRTLFQFLLRLERLRATGTRLTTADPGREGEGVTLLSIHRAKGLEKPVVLVCGLNHRFNREDLRRPVLFHPKLGVGPKGLDTERMVEYPTVARRAVSLQLEREQLSEELRLLYVAMTRAREKLILTIALPEGERALARLGEECTVPLAPMSLLRQQSMGAWVLLHAMTRPEGGVLREAAGLSGLSADGLASTWDIRWIDGQTLTKAEPIEGHWSDAPEAAMDEGVRAALREQFRWVYPNRSSINLPSKLTATQIKGRSVDQEAAEDAPQSSQSAEPDGVLIRPDFIARERGLTAAQRGTAMHLAMQYMPLEGDHSPLGIQAHLDRLQALGFLTKLQRQAIKPNTVSAFFTSPLGQAMTKAERCQREFKFSMLVPAQDYVPDAQDEQILLQGVIDVWFEEEGEVSVIDFKTDRVTPGGERARAEDYRPQLEAYSNALSAILQRPVRRKILWFFATDCSVEL